MGVEARDAAHSNLAVRVYSLVALGRGARTLLPPFFSQKAQSPSQGRILRLWQLSLLGSWLLSPQLSSSNPYPKSMSYRELST